MRIRSIKPDFWTSQDVADLPWEFRLLFIGLWSYVDDNGVGRDVERLIVADLFPLEDDPLDTLAKVSRGLQKLSEKGLIDRYTGEDGRSYLQITKWHHQKIDHPAKARYPRLTSGNTPTRETLAKPSREVRETVAPVTGEQGNRGTDTPPTADDNTKPKSRARVESDDEKFLEFWAAYPKRVGKGAARKAWDNALKRGAAPGAVIAAASAFATLRAKDDPKYIPHPATWLNQERYDDEPANAQAGGPDRVYFTPTDPPDGIAGDPDAYREWYQGEVRKHRAELEQARKGGGAQ